MSTLLDYNNVSWKAQTLSQCYTNGSRYRCVNITYDAVYSNMSKNATERSREKSGFQVCCTDVGGMGCDQNVDEGKQWLVTYNEQKSRFFFFLFISVMHPPPTCTRCAPCYANYYYFSPNYKTKAKLPPPCR